MQRVHRKSNTLRNHMIDRENCPQSTLRDTYEVQVAGQLLFCVVEDIDECLIKQAYYKHIPLVGKSRRLWMRTG